MFASLTCQQRTAFREEATSLLVMLFVVGPAVMLLLGCWVWLTAALLGAPAIEMAADFLGDAFGLLAFVQVYVVMIMTVPGILCMLSDPVGTRLAMWALGSCLVSLMPQVFFLLQTIGIRAASQPVVATLIGARFSIRVHPAIPELRFTPGASPQIE